MKKLIIPVGDHSSALVFPESDYDLVIVGHGGLGVYDALPDAAQVSQVENVVKLGGRGQHFNLVWIEILDIKFFVTSLTSSILDSDQARQNLEKIF